MHEIKKLDRPIEITGIYAGRDDLHREKFYFPGEIHDFWEAVLVKKGEMTAMGDTRIYRLKRGDLLFHKPMEFHNVRIDRPGTRLQIISFTARGEGMKSFENKCCELSESEIEIFGFITKKFMAAAAGYDAGRKEEFQREGNMGAVMLEELLMSIAERPSPGARAVTMLERQYLDIVGVMNTNIDRMLSLDELASLCSISTGKLKKVFRDLSDVGAAKFFLRMKLRKAMKMISEGSSVKEAGAAVGFSDMNYFSAVFRRETGMTPTSYRRSADRLFN